MNFNHHSDINVSGIRVMSYLREAGIPQANIDVSAFSDKSCSANKKNINVKHSLACLTIHRIILTNVWEITILMR